MSAASPTPLGAGSHFTSLGRRTSARQALRRPSSRAYVGRAESQPIASSIPSHSISSQAQQYDAMHDSSDDEIPVPMKLSALTKALLNDGAAADGPAAAAAAAAAASSLPQTHSQPEPRIMTRRRSYLTRSTSSADGQHQPPEQESFLRETRRHVRTGSVSAATSRPVSPARARDTSPAPRKRVVRLSTTPGGGPTSSTGLRRSLSGSSRRRPESRNSTNEDNQIPLNPPAPAPADDAEINTPAQPVRRVQIAIGSSAQRQRSAGGSSSGAASRPASRLSGSASGFSGSASAYRSDNEGQEEPRTESRPHSGMNQGSVSRFGGSVKAREDQNVHGSMRVKRLGKLPGSFLSGPARRGRRRESEEDRLARDNGDGEMQDNHYVHDMAQGERDVAPESFHESAYRDFAASGSPVSSKERAGSRRQSIADLRAAASLRESQKDQFETARKDPIEKARLEIPSARDQENEIPIPSAFGRRKMSMSILDKEPVKTIPRSPSLVELGSRPVQRPTSPLDRHILSTISQNVQKTPHVVVPIQKRPAPPPPPKMSVLDAATATAGAATTGHASKKKSIILKVNGRSYQRVDCIGRGGSAKVYRVTAENGKMFALKRVNIENADELTVKGYKGEINLLQKLSNVERVIQLYDFELNSEKHVLSLVSMRLCHAMRKAVY